MGYHEPLVRGAPSLPPGSVVMGVQHDDIRDFLDMPVYVSVATVLFMVIAAGLAWVYFSTAKFCPRTPKLTKEQEEGLKTRLQEKRMKAQMLEEGGGEEAGDGAEYDEEEGEETQEAQGAQEAGEGYQAVAPPKAKRPTPTVMRFPRKNPNRLAGSKFTDNRGGRR